MASRRIAQTKINWSAIADRVPPNQKVNFGAFKTKADTYLRAVLANPENPPKIDWIYYKNLVPKAGLVDTFQKQYDAIKVPYPTENLTAQVEAEGRETKAEIDNYKKTSEERINGYQEQIQHLKSLLPYDQMTMEDYRDAFPEQALDPINRPTFWPHTPDDLLSNKPKEHAEH